MAASTGLIRADILGELHSLSVAARVIVEGLRSGAHRSPLKGHSVDFADHRPYVPGDDIRHLDWKVVARRDRLVLKRYEAEIDLSCTIAVDGSASMGYQGSRATVTKYRYASLLAASITYLVLNQQDRVGLVIFNDQEVAEEPPRSQSMLERVCHRLEEHAPVGGTDSGESLRRLGQTDMRRGLVVVITDGLEEPDQIVAAIDRLRHRGHDVAVIWLLDPDEVDLGLGALSRFEGLEGEGEVIAEPKALRQAYRQVVEEHRIALEQACLGRRAAFIPANTGEPPHQPLNQLLVALQRS